jgi:hypothetical protein
MEVSMMDQLNMDMERTENTVMQAHLQVLADELTALISGTGSVRRVRAVQDMALAQRNAMNARALVKELRRV